LRTEPRALQRDAYHPAGQPDRRAAEKTTVSQPQRPLILCQRPSFLTDMRPFAPSDGCDGPGLIDEAVPRVAGGIDDVVVAFKTAA
jgi:hypothetical protein